MMGLSGLPSLLAVAGLLGFAVVEAMLLYWFLALVLVAAVLDVLCPLWQSKSD
jgi:hypothetical protein